MCLTTPTDATSELQVSKTPITDRTPSVLSAAELLAQLHLSLRLPLLVE
jgi:hypothetical protein